MQSECFPLVSVGIPTFNRALSLTRAIESVLQQTYSNIQLIISDNASIDETQSICEKFCQDNPRIVYIRQETNMGAANNFTQVLNLSTAEYFMWLGDDDWIDNSYISECMSILIANPEYSLVSGKAKYFVNKNFKYEGNTINLEQDNGCNRVLNYYMQVADNGVFYGVMRREYICKVPMQNTLGGDWLMIAAIAFLGKVKTVTNTSINRECNWSEDYYKKLAKRLNLAASEANNPYIFIAFSASKHIITNPQIYEGLNQFQLTILSQKVLFSLLKEKQLSIYRSNIINLIRANLPTWAYSYLRTIYQNLKKRFPLRKNLKN